MKKITITILLISIFAFAVSADTLRIGGSVGLKKNNDEKSTSIYNYDTGGLTYNVNLEVFVLKHFGLYAAGSFMEDLHGETIFLNEKTTMSHKYLSLIVAYHFDPEATIDISLLAGVVEAWIQEKNPFNTFKDNNLGFEFGGRISVRIFDFFLLTTEGSYKVVKIADYDAGGFYGGAGLTLNF
ncbi:MAG: hypothetical protein PHG05_01760 [Candidatus Nanoarchaeia archaeon]|nr:hypothetical protein [Candidatus Nanoarchaeia archaeon]